MNEQEQQVRQQFEALSRRWPEIARWTDHPLTFRLTEDWSIGRSMALELLSLLTIGLIVAFTVAIQIDGVSVAAKGAMMGGYILGLSLMGRLRKQREFGLWMMLRRKDPGTLTDLKMLPMPFRQLVAIDCMAHATRPTYRVLAWTRLAALSLICGGGLHGMVVSRIPEYQKGLPIWWIVYALLPVLLIQFHRMQAEIMMRQIIYRFYVTMVPANRRLQFNGKLVARWVLIFIGIYLGVGVLAGGVIWGASALGYPPQVYLPLMASALEAVAIVILPRAQNPRRTEKYFTRTIEQMEPYFLEFGVDPTPKSLVEGESGV